MDSRTLTYRAESACIGALLHRPDSLDYGSLDPRDFAYALNGRVLRAVTRMRYGNDDLQDLARIASQSGLPETHLAELKDAAPDPAHGAAYQLLVQEASALRQLRAAGDLAVDQAQHGLNETVASPGRNSLAAIGRYVQAERTRDKVVALRAALDWFNPDRMTGVRTAAGPGAEDLVERLVLGALIRQDPESDQILARVQPERFKDPVNREIYRTVLQLRNGLHPVDSLTADWAVVRQVSYAHEGALLAPSGDVQAPDYLAALASVQTGRSAMPAAMYLATRDREPGHHAGDSSPVRRAAYADPGPRGPAIEPPPPSPGTSPAPGPKW